jgi:hypothetical protein
MEEKIVIRTFSIILIFHHIEVEKDVQLYDLQVHFVKPDPLPKILHLEYIMEKRLYLIQKYAFLLHQFHNLTEIKETRT